MLFSDIYVGSAVIAEINGSVTLGRWTGSGQVYAQASQAGFDWPKAKKSLITFESQPADAQYLLISYEQDGKNKSERVERSANGSFAWDPSESGLLQRPGGLSASAIAYTAFDANDRPLLMGQGNIVIGSATADGRTSATLPGSSDSCILEFDPRDTHGQPVQASELRLSYRPVPNSAADQTRPFEFAELRRDITGRYFFDATALPTDTEYEYHYVAVDAYGNALLERQGYFLTGTRSQPVTNIEIAQQAVSTVNVMTIDRRQTHNAFGEVSSETDGNGNTTVLQYNSLGNLVLKREPAVSVTLANGYATLTAPETRFYYDRMGNLVGLKDANGNLSTQQWNYGLSQAAIAKSWDAQHYSKAFLYDSFSNLRVSTDELGRRTAYTYDAGNRLTQVDHPVLANGQHSVDRYEYDSVGNRIAHTNALGGRERTYYDMDGRVVQTVSAQGRTVRYDYAWSSSIASLGNSVGGGWVKTTTDANGMTEADQVDIFDRVTWHRDLGGHTFTYEYNWAGLLSRQTGSTGQHIEYEYYAHGLVRTIRDDGAGTIAQYEYDNDGNRTYEGLQLIAGGTVLSAASITYDALNRVTSITDPLYTVSYEYDAVGNRRRMFADYHDALDGRHSYQEYWYEYDSLNRFTVSMGQLPGGARGTSATDRGVSIVAGSGGDGVQLGYNAAGERVLARYAVDGRTEAYAYDANGYLTDQRINGVLVRQRTNDLLGRTTNYVEWNAAGTQQTTSVLRVWDGDSVLTQEQNRLDRSLTTYKRMADGTLEQVTQRPGDVDGTWVTTSYEYAWWEGAQQKRVTTQASNPDAPGWQPATSTYSYDVNGHVKTVYDDGGGEQDKARAFTYRTDTQGRVLRRDGMLNAQVDANGVVVGGAASRLHHYYYVDGHRVGNVGDDGIEKVDYAQELAGQLDKGSDSRYKVYAPVATAEFDNNYMAVSAVYPGTSPGSWTVHAGDTLQSVAAALWGDSTLWYVLAQANGLKGEDALKAGQVLTVPNRITNVHNTSGTFRAYDAGEAIGNTQPTLPDPPPPPGPDGGCGMSSIISVVVAVVASVVTVGALAPVMGVIMAGAAAGGMAAAMGSQNPNGPQLKDVALGAMGGAVTGGFASSGMGGSLASSMGGLGETGSQIAAQAVLGAGRSAVTQGLGIAIGAQSGFDWKGVAASAIAASAGYGVSQSVLGKVPVVGGIASGMAAGAASTLARGGSLTNNLGAISADAVASTVGNMVLGQVAQASVGKSATTAGGNGSNSALYGVNGSYDELVRQTAQASYSANAGDQFAGMAGWDLALSQQAFVGGLQDEFGVRANDALAASRAQDQALKQQLGTQFAGQANMSLAAQPLAAQRAEHAAVAARQNAAGLDFGRGPNNWSDDALAIDLGHRGGSWSENDARLVGTDSGFVRGLSGDRRSVLEGPAPLSEKIGAGIGAGLTALGDFVAGPAIEIGNQYRDVFAAANGATGGWSSGLAQQVSAGNYGAAALTEVGAIAGTMPLAGAVVNRAVSLAPSFADAAYGMSERYLVGGRMYVVPPAGVGFGAGVADATSAFRGGAYGRLETGVGIERHHLPANSASPITTYSGPAIQMDKADHLLTSSHGSRGLAGAEYRSEIEQLVQQGQMRQAMATEIWDVRRVAVAGGGVPTKYNGAIREMLDYSYGKGWLDR
ncbi:LysM peptidoglycan-binding domain-containing protein [Paraburkholderia sp. IW21]|uniref:LysM peptidoglycan-binding domain-containing protein n=1 Tax=Paraburkholderia sp. IW21 TaxID=3242488 RepID=UPI00351FCC28